MLDLKTPWQSLNMDLLISSLIKHSTELLNASWFLIAFVSAKASQALCWMDSGSWHLPLTPFKNSVLLIVTCMCVKVRNTGTQAIRLRNTQAETPWSDRVMVRYKVCYRVIVSLNERKAWSDWSCSHVKSRNSLLTVSLRGLKIDCSQFSLLFILTSNFLCNDTFSK